MKAESGRSLIEVIGVLAIGGVMAVATLGVYNMVRSNQTRTIADAELEQIAHDTKLLLEMRGTYEGISVDYLIKAGALPSDKAPIGGDGWSVTASADGVSFSINLVDLSNGECEYFAETTFGNSCFNQWVRRRHCRQLLQSWCKSNIVHSRINENNKKIFVDFCSLCVKRMCTIQQS